MTLTIDDIQTCFGGEVPAVMSTASPDGVPNVVHVSHVFRIDSRHVAISNQFLGKSKANIERNPLALILVVDPRNLDSYRLLARHVRTEVDGATFDVVNRTITALAALTGMDEVFRLRSVEIFRSPAGRTGRRGGHRGGSVTAESSLAALAAFSSRLAGVADLEELADTALDSVVADLGFPHVLLLLHDAAAERLVTFASRGYDTAGVGSEVLLGHGVIGTAATGRRTMRIGNLQRMLAYLRTAQRRPQPWVSGAEAPLPGLPGARSQVAAPMVVAGGLVGVLAVESDRAMAFEEDDEQLLSVAAQLLAALIAGQLAETGDDEDAAEPDGRVSSSPPLANRTEVRVRHYLVDGSTFLDDEYLIKGVAGRLLWKLAAAYTESGRTAYTNREARLDPGLEMPSFKDNFESRLVLLKRRLEERDAPIRIHRPARGRFEVEVRVPLRLERIAVSGS